MTDLPSSLSSSALRGGRFKSAREEKCFSCPRSRVQDHVTGLRAMTWISYTTTNRKDKTESSTKRTKGGEKSRKNHLLSLFEFPRAGTARGLGERLHLLRLLELELWDIKIILIRHLITFNPHFGGEPKLPLTCDQADEVGLCVRALDGNDRLIIHYIGAELEELTHMRQHVARREERASLRRKPEKGKRIGLFQQV